MDQLTVLKLGGSAITDKARECAPDIPTIQNVADQLRDYDRPLLLIHGGGSYAHPFVAKSGWAETRSVPGAIRVRCRRGVFAESQDFPKCDSYIGSHL